jgi:hypothetical protein
VRGGAPRRFAAAPPMTRLAVVAVTHLLGPTDEPEVSCSRHTTITTTTTKVLGTDHFARTTSRSLRSREDASFFFVRCYHHRRRKNTRKKTPSTIFFVGSCR